MIELLAADPGRYIEVQDDAKAQQLLLELGLLAKLQEPAPISSGQVRLATLDTHPTHVIAAYRFVGHANPKDNGYVVKCYPRSKFTLEQVDSLIGADMKAADAARPVFHKRFSVRPEN